MRASSLGRKTRLTTSAISRAKERGSRSKSVKIDRIRATVTAGVSSFAVVTASPDIAGGDHGVDKQSLVFA